MKATGPKRKEENRKKKGGNRKKKRNLERFSLVVIHKRKGNTADSLYTYILRIFLLKYNITKQKDENSYPFNASGAVLMSTNEGGRVAVYNSRISESLVLFFFLIII